MNHTALDVGVELPDKREPVAVTAFRTIVTNLPPTPLGLLPARWHLEHRCTACHRQVATDDLVTHAQQHHDHRRAPYQTPPRLPLDKT
ncbi:MAG: hypothetical protein ACRD29_15745 [Acidimicrobiales bacterium]